MARSLLTPAAWLATFFVLLFVYTKLIGPVPFSVSSITTQKSTTFDVTGEGKVLAKPDMAFVSVGIAAQAQTVKSVQDQVNFVINKVSAGLKEIGVEAKDIQTRNYSVNPSYDYTGGSPRITGYSANTTLSVKVRNLDNINQVIDTATSNGANQIGDISFEIEDKTKVENEAREKGVEEAKKKAENIAKIAGFKLGRIINYSENQQGLGRPIPLLLETTKATGTPTQVEPGSSEVTISVTLSYEIQ